MSVTESIPIHFRAIETLRFSTIVPNHAQRMRYQFREGSFFGNLSGLSLMPSLR